MSAAFTPESYRGVSTNGVRIEPVEHKYQKGYNYEVFKPCWIFYSYLGFDQRK